MQRVLLTGAAGEIGSVLRTGLKGRYPILRLSHRRPIEDLDEGEEFRLANLDNFDEVAEAMSGVDAVIHMGGKAQEGTWDEVLSGNIIGTYNVFEAARQHGVKRVVFASSHHVGGYYRRGRDVAAEDVPRPDSRYGATKVFGEALARLYADKHGIGVVCLRIGSFQERPRNERMLSTWISFPDTVELVRCSLEAEPVHFEVAYGVSNNTRNWWRDNAAETLDYRPKDNAEDYAEEIMAGLSDTLDDAKPAVDFSGASMTQEAVMKAVTANTGAEPLAARAFQGGPLCAMEFTGDLSSID